MDTIKCPDCNTELNGKASVCHSCGWENSASENKTGEKNIIKSSEDLSPEQISSFQSGVDIEFIPDDELADVSDEVFNPIDSINLTVNDDESGKKEKKPNKKNQKVIKIKKHKKTKKPVNPLIIRVVVTVLMVVVSYALGVVSLFFYNQLHFADNTYQTGHDAVLLVSEKAPAGKIFKATDIYIKPNSDITHCIIFGEFISKIGERSITYFRLEIDNNNRSNTILFYAFDETEYNRLKNGSDEERIKASVMKNYYDNFLKYVEEINSGGFGWRVANTDYINLMISEEKK